MELSWMPMISQSSFAHGETWPARARRLRALALVGFLAICCGGCSQPAVRPPPPTSLRAHGSADHFPTAAETMIRTPSAQTK
jgi:hypothetical protein